MGDTMRRATTCVGGVTLAVTGTTIGAQAAEPVHIDVDEVFVEGGVSTFTSTVDGCETGTVATSTNQNRGSRRFGIFNGFKVFSCSDGGSFVVRLQARSPRPAPASTTCTTGPCDPETRGGRGREPGLARSLRRASRHETLVWSGDEVLSRDRPQGSAGGRLHRGELKRLLQLDRE